MEDVWSQGDAQLEVAMSSGREQMVIATAEKMKLFGSAGKSRVCEKFSTEGLRKW
jgi:hypothetical protein